MSAIHNEIRDLLDRRVENLSREAYRDVLDELQATIQCRLDCLDDEEAEEEAE